MLLKIPPIPTLDSQLSRSTQRQNGEVLADVRTKDGAHVSPRKLHAVCSKVVSSALSKRGVGEERVVVSVDPQELTLSVKLGCDWTAELVPCVAAPAAVDSDLFYVTRWVSVTSARAVTSRLMRHSSCSHAYSYATTLFNNIYFISTHLISSYPLAGKTRLCGARCVVGSRRHGSHFSHYCLGVQGSIPILGIHEFSFLMDCLGLKEPSL